MLTHFLYNLVPKYQFLVVSPIFFRTTGLQHKLLILIEYPNTFHGKLAKNKVGVAFRVKSGPILAKCCEKYKEKKLFFYFTKGIGI